MKTKVSYLAEKRCYLSGPIENDTNLRNWRSNPKKILTKNFKINVFDPFADPKQVMTSSLNDARQNRDFESIVKIAKGFVRKDLAMVDRADFLIAYLPYKVPTCGTHHEIINSNNAKKPTLLVADGNKANLPLWYYGFIPEECMFDNWADLYEYLKKVNKGEYKNNNRWHFIYGLI